MQRENMDFKYLYILALFIFGLNNIQAQINFFGELDKPLSLFLLNVDDIKIIDVLEPGKADSMIINTKNIDGKIITFLDTYNRYDTVKIYLSADDKVTNISAVSLLLNRRVGISFYNNGKAKIYEVSNIQKTNNISTGFDLKGKISFEIISDNECRLSSTRYHRGGKGKVSSITISRNCSVLSAYTFSKRGKLTSLTTRGNNNNIFNANKYGYWVKNGKLIEND
jgi:hypothetical protein